MNSGPRIQQEKKTVEKMIQLYCAAHHSHGHCESCEELLTYAHKRLDLCVFGESKATCGKCPIHCYKPDRKEQIKQIMRYAGPRMVYKHPILAFHHLFDGMRPVPERPSRKNKS